MSARCKPDNRTQGKSVQKRTIHLRLHNVVAVIKLDAQNQ